MLAGLRAGVIHEVAFYAGGSKRSGNVAYSTYSTWKSAVFTNLVVFSMP
jgi:hypothetical protein